MPIARVQMPDGRIARIEVPDGTTPQEAQRAAASLIPLQQARAQFEQDVADLPPEAQRIGRERFNADPRIRQLEAASQIRPTRRSAPPRQKGTGIAAVDNVLDWTNQALIGIPQGLENLGAAITDPVVRAIYGDDVVKADRARREARYDNLSNALTTRDMSGARMTGQIAGTLPLAAAKAPAAFGRFAPAATRAIQGAIGGAAVRDSDSDVAPNVALGTAVNVALPPAVSWAVNSRYGRPVVDAVRNTVAPTLNRVGAVLDDASEAVLARVNPKPAPAYSAAPLPPSPIMAPRVTGATPPPPASELGRAERVRLERLRRSGVSNPTTGMVTRNPNAWTFEQETAKRYGDLGEPLQQALLTADQQLNQRARELVGSQGGSIGREAVGQRVIDAAKARNEALNEEVGALYRQGREAFGDVRVTNLRNLLDLPNNPEWADNAVYDDMLAALNKRLARYADADGGATGLTVSQAEELRKFIGNLGPDSGQTFAIRNVIKNALDTDILDNVGGQPFAEARQAAAARFAEFNNTLPGRIAKDRIPPEQVANRVMGPGVPLSDLRDLRTTLSNAPGGEDALRALPAQMVEDTLQPALGPEGGVQGKAVYENFLKNAPRLRAVLEPSAYKDVRRFALAARDARAAVPNSNVNYSNTASAYSNFFAPAQAEQARGLLGTYGPRVMGAAAGTVGAANPMGGIAGWAATQAAQDVAERRSADALARRMAEQVMAASDPQTAANLVAMRQWQAQQDALVRAERDRLAGAIGASPVLGGTAAGLLDRRR